MKRFLKSKLIKTATMVVIVGLAGTWAIGAARDRYEVATMKMKTVCVGRFLIDLPEEARVLLTQPRIDGFNIDTFDETDEAFWTRLAAREAEIRAKPDRLGGNKNLESVRDVKTDSGLVGKIFVHSRTVTEGTAAKGLELEHYRYEGVAVEALVHATGISIDLGTDDLDTKWIENMPKLVAKLVANPTNLIPTEPGYCIDRAYFRDPLTADDGEQITMRAKLPSHPDIELALDLMAGVKSTDQGLLARSTDSDAGFSFSERMRISRLRATPRTIAGLTGDELVERFFEENNSIGYSFVWEVNGTKDNVLIPYFSLEMHTGKGNRAPVPSSLSQGAAIALWDRITNSIRFRPTESTKVSATPPQAVPLGSVATAGENCPFSGWWLCSEGGNGIGVLGGQRQYLKQGQRMPQALLLPPQTLLEKMRGLQPSYESATPTKWKLVDKRGSGRTVPTVPLAQANPAAPSDATVTTDKYAALGTRAATGSPCPTSGWWRCEERNALDGTRWFARGSLLPAVTLAVPTAVFSRWRGASRTTRRDGTWRLVRVALAPEPEPDGRA